MFAGKSAWFSSTCDDDFSMKWEKNGGVLLKSLDSSTVVEEDYFAFSSTNKAEDAAWLVR